MSKSFITYLPDHDQYPGAEIAWRADCRLAFTNGVECAKAWLSNPDSCWLWGNLILEREALPPGIQRRAFEVGFLSRIHQRLCSPQGGNHKARRTRLRL
ncbi:hypothetical protein D3879_07040 [Pseudomonas cavernicola]|uniref:LasR-specific antiactivator QslA domain-containing protein n=1 Tax=Pseudomonas cavernicola TaxID=2320866 RepID=A0A418XKN9_9PSED|nr:LasR-specific antiactivator QslA [Pseudomonas cavernicola]RJG13024.1 hypothetical protein D3879_07040 [Pseudomonas cavernicola]